MYYEYPICEVCGNNNIPCISSNTIEIVNEKGNILFCLKGDKRYYVCEECAAKHIETTQQRYITPEQLRNLFIRYYDFSDSKIALLKTILGNCLEGIQNSPLASNSAQKTSSSASKNMHLFDINRPFEDLPCEDCGNPDATLCSDIVEARDENGNSICVIGYGNLRKYLCKTCSQKYPTRVAGYIDLDTLYDMLSYPRVREQKSSLEMKKWAINILKNSIRGLEEDISTMEESNKG